MVRTLAREESSKHIPAFQNKNYAASHVGRTMQVSIEGGSYIVCVKMPVWYMFSKNERFGSSKL
jgi:hypothetical protein